jgi:hypothetical protein
VTTVPEAPENVTPEESTFGLDDVLSALSGDLKRAQDQAKEAGVGLFLREVEVELAFTVERSRDVGGGINLKVFGVGFGGGGKLGASSETVHRIQLKLGPAIADAKTPGLITFGTPNPVQVAIAGTEGGGLTN